MKLFLILYAVIQLILSACVLSLVTLSGCGVEHVPALQLHYPMWALISIAALSIGVKTASAYIILIAGVLMWYPTALSWSAICTCHDNSWLLTLITLATALPLIPAFVQTTRQNTTGTLVFCLLYLTGMIPAIMLLLRNL